MVGCGGRVGRAQTSHAEGQEFELSQTDDLENWYLSQLKLVSSITGIGKRLVMSVPR